MKKYLFGLGAMLVGAGLMFVLMHGEVSAEDYKKIKCEIFKSDSNDSRYTYCKIKDLTCVLASQDGTFRNSTGGVSCVKTGMFK